MHLSAPARRIIARNWYLTIATARHGAPWISPVFFAHDGTRNDRHVFYWSSARASLHSRLIAANPRVAAVIFNSSAREGTGDGLYMVGKAAEVRSMAEKKRAMHVLTARTGKPSRYYENITIKDYTGAAPVAFYRFVPSRAWTLGKPVRRGKFLIDVRRDAGGSKAQRAKPDRDAIFGSLKGWKKPTAQIMREIDKELWPD